MEWDPSQSEHKSLILLTKASIFLWGWDFQELSNFTSSDQLSHKLLNCPRSGHLNCNLASELHFPNCPYTESTFLQKSFVRLQALVLGVENVVCCLVSHVRLFVIPWTVAHQPPLSMGFLRQEYWSGLPFPSPRDLPPRDWTWVSCLAGRF